LLEEIDVEFDLVFGHTARHENAAQHLVFYRQARLHAGRNVTPRLVARHLLVIGRPLAVEDAKRLESTRFPMLDGLDRIVDRRVDVFSYELDSNRAATLERYVGELLTAGLPLDGDRDDLILLLGTSATHLVLPVCTSLHGLDVLFGRIVWSIRRHPENELVERQHGNGCQVLPTERCPCAQRRGEQVRQCDDDLMWVAFAVLDLEEAL